MSTMSDSSLRERGKARRRDAIERAALRLFAERGFEETTVAEVAELAEVAPRTVSLYFPTKLDLALAHMDEGAERLIAALEAKPAERPTFEVFAEFLQDETACVDEELRELRAAMFARNPQLKALGTVKTDQALQLGASAIARELGRPEDDVAVAVLVAGTLGVMRDFAELTVRYGPDAVRTAALRFLAGGIDGLRDA
ncbi:MAG: TetR family transcriptional regulator [Actinomycetales bacterium]